MAAWVDDVNEVQECNEQDNQVLGDGTVALTSNKADLAIHNWFASWDSAGDGALEFRINNEGSRSTIRTDWLITLLLHTQATVSHGQRYDLHQETGAHILEPTQYVYRDAASAARFSLVRHSLWPINSSGDLLYVALGG